MTPPERPIHAWKPLEGGKGAMAATRPGDMAGEVPPCLPRTSMRGDGKTPQGHHTNTTGTRQACKGGR